MAKGYMVDGVSLHSLHAGGAMAMKLSGATDSTIMWIGRWASLTYLTYIHSQIGALSAGVVWKMSQQLIFQNVGRNQFLWVTPGSTRTLAPRYKSTGARIMASR
jgi:hypothetical protein